MSLLAEGGLDAVTVQELARAVDLTAGALYRYFPGKEALLAAMQRHSIEVLEQRWAEHAVDQRAAARERGVTGKAEDLASLLAAAEFYVGLASTLPHHVKLINVLLADPRNLISDDDVGRVAPAFFGLLRRLAELFDRAAASGALSPGSSLDRAMVYWSALQGTLQLDKLQRFDAHLFQPQRLGRQLAQTLLLGWGAGAAPLERAAVALDLSR